jgi:hypothetical protein
MSSFLTQGGIVWATIPDPRGGNEKSRPAVIVTATNKIDPAGKIEIAAVTTLTAQAPFAETGASIFVEWASRNKTQEAL